MKRIFGCLCFAWSLNVAMAQTVVPTPSIAATNTTATINLAISGTKWKINDPPSFSIVQGDAKIAAQTVTGPGSATLVVSFGTDPGPVEVLDPSTNSDFYITAYPALRLSQPFVVTGTKGNVLTLTGIGSSWGGQTRFSFLGCPTASIVSQTVTSPTTASITVNAGGSECMATIKDVSSGGVAQLLVHTPRQWYVRADGGTRYSANRAANGLSVQCNGLYDAPYPGKGVNQNCAFNDYRFLYDDQATYNQLSWVISGGDTVIVDNTAQWPVGFSEGTTPSEPWCPGIGPYACLNPTIPAGISSQHTRILGRNYASCSADSKKTQLYGRYAVITPLSLQGAQWVDVECFEITSHGNCIVHGSPNPNPCNSGYPISDYDGDGIVTSNTTANVFIQDVWIHGHTDRGVKGAIGGTVTCERCNIAYNGMAGWDFDDGSNSYCYENNCYGTPSQNGLWQFYDSTIQWSGCEQEYPITHTYPAAFCYGQQVGGYGDGVGSPPGGCVNIDVERSVFAYNTQDALDVGHADAGPSGAGYGDQSRCSFVVKGSLFLGNMGAGPKWGANLSPATVTDNLMLLNCARMIQPIAGAPVTFNLPFLLAGDTGDFCRAGDAISFGLRNANSTVFSHNTIVTYAPTTFDLQCWDGDGGCNKASLTFEDNVVLGIDNAFTYIAGGRAGGPGDFCFLNHSSGDCGSQGPVVGSVIRDHNLWYGMRNIKGKTGYTGEVIADPQFVGEPVFSSGFPFEAVLDNYNMTLSGGSPALGMGVALSSVPADYLSRAFASEPAAGALESGSSARATLSGAGQSSSGTKNGGGGQ